MNIDYALLSEIGSRKINEDAVGMTSGANGHLFILCDGLGGHGGGEVASAMVIDTAKQVFLREALPAEYLIEQCIKEANAALIAYQRQMHKLNEYKTTITILNIRDGLAAMAHAGDSRIYTFKSGKIIGQTLDHSVPQMLVAQGEISAKQLRFHEDRNRILRALGVDEEPRYTFAAHNDIGAGHSFLLASDGFWELILEKDMLKAAKNAPSAQAWLANMATKVKTAGKGKNMDNFSAIAINLN